jgi:tetratricopeptide (TPR) repeat protein
VPHFLRQNPSFQARDNIVIMAYPGNTELSPQAKDRVMTAFKQVVGKLQQGNREEALIGLEFVLRLDPAYAPALNLRQQLSSGDGEIVLSEIVSQLQAPTTDTINSLLVEAVEDFNSRDFEGARSKVEQVLLDLPGHEEARNLLGQIEAAAKGESQVGQFLAQARETLARGDSGEAANFVMMAQALDPHHRDIAATIAEIEKSGDVSQSQAPLAPTTEAEEEISFAPTDGAAPDFSATTEDAELFSTAPAEEAPVDAVGEPPPSHPEPAIGVEEVPATDLSAGDPESAIGVEELPATDVSAGDPEPAIGVEEAPVTDLSASDPEPVSGEPYYEDAAGNVADLFDSGPAAPADPEVEVDPDDAHAVIRDLLTRGGTAAAADDYSAAIDAWSRIFLIDPNHREAKDRIEHIRHAKEDLEKRIEPMLTDAEASFVSGDHELARNFVDRVLALYPNNVDATRLKEAIGGGAQPSAEVGAASEMPDLFSDEFAAAAEFGTGVHEAMESLDDEWQTPIKAKRRLSWQLWAAIGGIGLLIVAGTLWLAGVFVPEDVGEGRFEVVQQVLAEAEEMYNQKRVEEAIIHLEQNSATDDFQPRIDRRLEKYRKAVATPVATPIPEGLSISRELLADGRWMAAFERVMAELEAHPNDPGLDALRREILDTEPEAANLHGALAAGDRRAALSIAKDLLDERPDDPEVAAFYDRELFNAALAELRAFNLTGAEGYLTELTARQGDDEEARRILQFANTYKGRPVDIQLKIFVGNLTDR